VGNQRLLIRNLDEAWRGYVHNQNAEIGYLVELQRRTDKLVELLEAGGEIAEAIESVKASSRSCTNYHAWRKKYDEQR